MTLRPALLRMLPACLLCLAPAPLHAQLEGTLFTSPDQRAYMDFLRQEFLASSQDAGFNIEVPEIPEVPVEGTEETGPAEPVEFTFGGIMTSRDGTRSVWLNNQLLQESDLPDWVRIVSATPGLALQLDANGSRWLLKPGQTVDVTAGTIVEEYQRPAPAADEGTVRALTALVEAIMPEPATAASAPAPAPVPEPSATAEAPVATNVAVSQAAQGDMQTIAVEELSDEELDELIRALQEARQRPANAQP